LLSGSAPSRSSAGRSTQEISPRASLGRITLCVAWLSQSPAIGWQGRALPAVARREVKPRRQHQPRKRTDRQRGHGRVTGRRQIRCQRHDSRSDRPHGQPARSAVPQPGPRPPPRRARRPCRRTRVLGPWGFPLAGPPRLRSRHHDDGCTSTAGGRPPASCHGRAAPPNGDASRHRHRGRA